MTTHTEYCSRSLSEQSARALETLIRQTNAWFRFHHLKRQIASERRHLALLNDDALKDIGITRHQAEIEARLKDLPSDRLIRQCQG